MPQFSAYPRIVFLAQPVHWVHEHPRFLRPWSNSPYSSSPRMARKALLPAPQPRTGPWKCPSPPGLNSSTIGQPPTIADRRFGGLRPQRPQPFKLSKTHREPRPRTLSRNELTPKDLMADATATLSGHRESGPKRHMSEISKTDSSGSERTPRSMK